MNYARALKIIRATKEITQKDLSLISGIDPSLISRFESGQRIPSNRSLKVISKSLNVPLGVIDLFAKEKADLNKLEERDLKVLSTSLLRIIS